MTRSVPRFTPVAPFVESRPILRRLGIGATMVGLVLILTAGLIPAQQPPAQPPPPAAPTVQPAGDPNGNGMEVLARGPVHEAYAETAQAPAATPIVPKMPPDPVEELPPDQKPEGDNVQWIPGYFHYDEDRKDFIWISGFWRAVPPGRVWVPGSWRTVDGGAQWAAGFWQEAPAQQAQQPQQQQPEVQYLPPPPASMEVGPTVAAPTTTSFYIPGSWVWRGRYVWRPGVWIEYRPNWIWVPAHFRWTPAGYVFIEGYWDYPLARRGVLYAPVAFTGGVYVQPGYVYSPTYVVSDQCMMGAMFVRRGWGCYYFGDYYGPTYATGGFSAWCGVAGPGGFTIGFGVGRAWGYDPLWSYYSVAYRGSPGWAVGMGDLYAGRFRGTIAPPPVTLVQQNVVISKVTNVNVVNVTNNFTVVNRSITVNNVNVSGLSMVAPAKITAEIHPEMKIQPITMQARRNDAVAARQIRQVAVQRAQHETAVVARGGAVLKATDVPRTMKLDVPKTALSQAHVVNTATTHGLPPSPHVNPAPKIDPHPAIMPKFDPRFPTTPKLPLVPKHDPKKDPHPTRP